METTQKKRIGVLRGGIGPEYNTSLQTGSYILRHMPRDLYTPVDIFIDKNGIWHKNGVAIEPDALSDYVDVAFNALHGSDGIDGKVHDMFEKQNIPFVGSDSVAIHMSGHRHLQKNRLKDLGVKAPNYILLKDLHIAGTEEEKLNHVKKVAMGVFKKMSGPWIVKPILGSASTHTYLVTTFAELISVLHHLSEIFDEVLVEEYIHGKEVVSAILEGYRDQDHYVTPVHEISKKGKILDEESRKAGTHTVHVIGKDIESHRDKINDLSRHLHQEFGMQDFSLFYFIVTPRDVYVIGIDPMPILAENEILHDLLNAIGCKEGDFIHHLIQRNL